MKIVRGNKLKYIPASHEDPKKPGVLKKILFTRNDFINGRLQMINWALLKPGKKFNSHFHENMEEVFIILNGKAKISINGEEELIYGGDAVFIPIKGIHQMENIGKEDLHYIALGVAKGIRGKTINV